MNLHNLRERAVDAFFDAFDSKPMRFLSDHPRQIGLALTLGMAAFYFGFVTRTPEPGAMLLGICFGTLHVAVGVFCCWLMYREKHPRAYAFRQPSLAGIEPSSAWPRCPDWMPTRTSDGRLVLPEPPGPHPGVKIEPSPDWPERR